jgi:uncharacterized protein
MKISAYNCLTSSFAPGKHLAFNALTGAFLSLDHERLDDYAALLASIGATGCPPDPVRPFQKTLIENGFVIPDECDEQAEISTRYHGGKAASRGLGLTIAPTITCNFGCSYCFQSHSNTRMDDARIEDLLTFVEARLEAGTSLNVTWFGGEPLGAFDVIEKLAPRLHALAMERDCTFGHSIITNGYLLTEPRAAFLASIPGFGDAQVTLDGARKYHDVRRPTLAGKGTFDRILDNLVAAARHIPILVRVNVDRRNIDGLEELLDALVERGLRNVGVYLGHVWHYTDEVGTTDILTKEEFAAIETQFKFLKFRKGFAIGAVLPQPKRGALCSADSSNSFVLGPGGGIFNCWNEAHQDARQAPGRYSPATEPQPSDVKQQWAQYEPSAKPECRSCPVAPLCMTSCPWEAAKVTDRGDCISARFNLADQLRLYDLEQSMALADKAGQRPADATETS